MLVGTCHCGAVTIELPSAPETSTSCNCSLCRRLGGLWAYYEFGTVRITGHPENTQEYIQGDKTLRTVRCATCGCTTALGATEARARSTARREPEKLRPEDSGVSAHPALRRRRHVAVLGLRRNDA